MGLFDKKDKKDIFKIEEDDLNDAKLSSLDFTDEAVRKRAFINVLGARLAMKSLFAKKIQANNIYSLYTIHSILEELDIADIYFEGIKIDVRLVFDRNEIFIPKSHFDYNLLPDLYLVLELKENFSGAELLGYFEPQTIDKSLANQNYYFFEHENLNDVKELKNVLTKLKKEVKDEISVQDMEKAQELILSLVDNEISQSDKLSLFKQLSESFSLREKMVELENFELVSRETLKHEDLFKDGILNIVGSQNLYENEPVEEISLEDAFAEFADLTEDEIQDNFEEDDFSESEFDTEFEEPEQETDDNSDDNSGEFAKGVAMGAAVTGAVAVSAAAAGAMAASTTAAIEGASAVGNAVETGAEVLSAGINFVDGIMDSAVANPELDLDEINDLIEAEESDEELNYEEFVQTKEEEEEKTIDEIEEEISEETEEESINQVQEEDSFASEDIEEEIEEETEEIVELERLEQLAEIDEIEAFNEVENLEEDLSVTNETEEAEENIDFEEYTEEEETIEEISEETEEEFLNQEEEEEENAEETNEVFNIDDFDFDMLPQNGEEPKEESSESLISFESIPTPVSEAEAAEKVTNKESDQELETMQKIKELEDLEALEEDEEIEAEEEQKEDKSDELISQVDEFLKDIEFSDEQKQLLENTLADESFDDLIEPVYSENETNKAEDPLQVLFNEEQAKLSSEKTLAEEIEKASPKNQQVEDAESEIEIFEKLFDKDKIIELFNQNKKMVITASVAGIVLASFAVGSSIIKKNQQAALQKAQAPTPVAAEGQTPGDLMQETGFNPDAPPNAAGQDLNALGAQDIPGENPQANPNRDMGKAVSDAFLSEPVNASITKVAWEVPEDLAYNDSFRKYLQIAGKNLKLNLQNELLLANELAYSNKVVIDMNIGRDGNLQSSNLTVSSGSKQIDKIVLQSVKETLKYLKMPSSELSGGSASVTLIINF